MKVAPTEAKKRPNNHAPYVTVQNFYIIAVLRRQPIKCRCKAMISVGDGMWLHMPSLAGYTALEHITCRLEAKTKQKPGVWPRKHCRLGPKPKRMWIVAARPCILSATPKWARIVAAIPLPALLSWDHTQSEHGLRLHIGVIMLEGESALLFGGHN